MSYVALHSISVLPSKYSRDSKGQYAIVLTATLVTVKKKAQPYEMNFISTIFRQTMVDFILFFYNAYRRQD